jgi:hypothetical protein
VIINHERLVEASRHYADDGYYPIDVPWIVQDEAYHVTKPESAGRDFKTIGGNLVASGEQSFLQLMLDGKLDIKDPYLSKLQCTTPCFRDEKYDELHHPYFMKVELIDLDACSSKLAVMIAKAHHFFRKYVPTRLVQIDYHTFDIVDLRFGIELGSYGIRKYKGFEWVYGTGLAEPRMTQVLCKNMLASVAQ